MTMQRKNDGLLWLGGVLLAVGILVLLKNIGIFAFDFIFKNFWAWAFIVVGAFIVYKALVMNPGAHGHVRKTVFSDGFVNGQNTMGDLHIALDQPNFRGGQLRTVFGELKVDATRLAIPPGSHILRLEVTFGEIHVKLPPQLPVRIVASNVAGDVNIYGQKSEGLNRHVEWQSETFDASDSKLEIVCSLVFGEIKIK